LAASVVDYTLFEFPAGFEDSEEQIGRVEQLSDAYHVRVGERADGRLPARDPAHPVIAEDGSVEELRSALEVLERVRIGVGRLADAGPPSVLLERAPAEAAEAVGLDRVLLSRIDDGALVAESLSDGTSVAELAPIPLGYPLVEAEALRRRRSLLVEVEDGGRHAFWEALRWQSYVAAPVVLETRVIGFFHGDRAGAWLRWTARRWRASPRASGWCSSGRCCGGACACSARSCVRWPTGPTPASASCPTA
jgi:hypothetical protein